MSDLDDDIPPGDPELAAFMRSMPIRFEQEEILSTDFLAGAFNRDRLKMGAGERIVNLACGHQTVTRNRGRATCPYCRYLILNGYDYDAFRRLGERDPLAGYWDRIKL